MECTIFFMSDEEFRQHIERGNFLEYEEFYGGKLYGTLKSHVEQELNSGYFVLLDIEVKGASNVKSRFGPDCLSIFVSSPFVAGIGKAAQGAGNGNRGNPYAQAGAGSNGASIMKTSLMPWLSMTILNRRIWTSSPLLNLI